MPPFAPQQARERMMVAARRLGVRAAASLRRLAAATSSDEDVRRREFILNVILLISIVFSAVLEATIIHNEYFVSSGVPYHHMPAWLGGGILLFYCAMLVASKKGRGRIVSYILIAIYATVTLYSGWIWGASLPATLLGTALVIVTSSILIGSTFGFISAGVMIAALTGVGVHEAMVLNVPDWRYDEITTTDVITYSAIFIFISFITWLSNREIGRSLGRARKSELLLKEERDSLERTVSERTQELQQAAAFGTLSQGLVHDLINPLSSISLYIEHLSDKPHDPAEAREIIAKTVNISRRMRSFMDSMRSALGSRAIPQAADGSIGYAEANVAEEIMIVRDILAYKARIAGVAIEIGQCDPIRLHIHPMRLHQLLANLVSNAIEACAEAARPSVHISAVRENGCVLIRIKDTGRGIAAQDMESVFERRFSTKSDGGGIGLATVKKIAEEELHGSIAVESMPDRGTTFTVTIPERIPPSEPASGLSPAP